MVTLVFSGISSPLLPAVCSCSFCRYANTPLPVNRNAVVTASVYTGNLVYLPVPVGRSLRCDAVGIAGVPEADVTLVAWTNAAGVTIALSDSAVGAVNAALKCGPNGPTSRRLQASAVVPGVLNASALSFIVAAPPQVASAVIASLQAVTQSTLGGAAAFPFTTQAINANPVLVAGLPAGGFTGLSIQDVTATGQFTPNSGGSDFQVFNGTVTATITSTLSESV